MHGLGVYLYSNGDVYNGMFKNGMKHGRGTYKYANGEEFVGKYKENMKNEKGKFKYLNGDCFDGDYANDKYNGKGIYTYANGFEDSCYVIKFQYHIEIYMKDISKTITLKGKVSYSMQMEMFMKVIFLTILSMVKGG